MLTKPRLLLHLEGAALLALTIFLYRDGHYSWWLFGLLFLAPDLAMLPYLIKVQWGFPSYNVVHTTVIPLLLLLAALLVPVPGIVPYVLIWLAHIGFDRMLGFGLKYPTSFNDTHLQHV
jgi:hypothetical protein